jgi:hypothetical protein
MKDLVSEIMLTPVLYDNLNYKEVTSHILTDDINDCQISFFQQLLDTRGPLDASNSLSIFQ